MPGLYDLIAGILGQGQDGGSFGGGFGDMSAPMSAQANGPAPGAPPPMQIPGGTDAPTALGMTPSPQPGTMPPGGPVPPGPDMTAAINQFAPSDAQRVQQGLPPLSLDGTGTGGASGTGGPSRKDMIATAMRSLAGGLGAVKSSAMPGEGLANAMGSAMKGGNTYEDEQEANRIKLLNPAVTMRGQDLSAKQHSDALDETSRYHTGTLALGNRNATTAEQNSKSLAELRKNGGNGRGAYNRPFEQRALDAERTIRDFTKQALQKSGANAPGLLPEERAKRQQAADAEIADYRGKIEKQFRVTPEDRISEQTRGTNPANPHQPQNDADFQAIPSGQTYVDPGDGQTYIKK